MLGPSFSAPRLRSQRDLFGDEKHSSILPSQPRCIGPSARPSSDAPLHWSPGAQAGFPASTTDRQATPIVGSSPWLTRWTRDSAPVGSHSSLIGGRGRVNASIRNPDGSSDVVQQRELPKLTWPLAEAIQYRASADSTTGRVNQGHMPRPGQRPTRLCARRRTHLEPMVLG